MQYPNRTILHATLHEDPELVKDALLKGAKVNVKTGDCRSTSLLIAVRKRNLEIVKILIAAKANVNTSNIALFTPIMLAVKNNDLDIVKILAEAHDFDSHTLMIFVSAHKKLTTPLHIAIKRGYKEMAGFLLTKQAPLNFRDREMDTAMHIAVKKPNLDMLKELFKHHRPIYNLDVPDGKNRTPLDLAVHLRLNGKKPYPLFAIRLLILSGCKVSGVKSHINDSPLNQAMRCYKTDPACTQALLKYTIFVFTTSTPQAVINLDRFDFKMSRQELLKYSFFVHAFNLSQQSVINFDQYPFNSELSQRTLQSIKRVDKSFFAIVDAYKETPCYRKVAKFIVLCRTEIEIMKCFSLQAQFSLYDVLLKCIVDKNQQFLSDNEGAQFLVLNALFQNKFPIYKELIASVLDDRELLVKILKKFCVFKENSVMGKLKEDCVIEIAKKLSSTDLLNFILAFLKFY